MEIVINDASILFLPFMNLHPTHKLHSSILAALRLSLFETLPTLWLSLPGLPWEAAVREACARVPKGDAPALADWLAEHRGALQDLLLYPALVAMLCEAWADGAFGVDCLTTTDVLWAIMDHRMLRLALN